MQKSSQISQNALTFRVSQWILRRTGR